MRRGPASREFCVGSRPGLQVGEGGSGVLHEELAGRGVVRDTCSGLERNGDWDRYRVVGSSFKSMWGDLFSRLDDSSYQNP